jgi:hypothetical protein
MSWVTVLWSMIASACLTFALVHGLVWWRQREAWANLLFALRTGRRTHRGGYQKVCVWVIT